MKTTPATSYPADGTFVKGPHCTNRAQTRARVRATVRARGKTTEDLLAALKSRPDKAGRSTA